MYLVCFDFALPDYLLFSLILHSPSLSFLYISFPSVIPSSLPMLLQFLPHIHGNGYKTLFPPPLSVTMNILCLNVIWFTKKMGPLIQTLQSSQLLLSRIDTGFFSTHECNFFPTPKGLQQSVNINQLYAVLPASESLCQGKPHRDDWLPDASVPGSVHPANKFP